MGKNMAIDGIAMQSSTLGKDVARLANDGNPDANYRHGSCTRTKIQDDPWWRVSFKRLVPCEGSCHSKSCSLLW